MMGEAKGGRAYMESLDAFAAKRLDEMAAAGVDKSMVSEQADGSSGPAPAPTPPEPPRSASFFGRGTRFGGSTTNRVAQSLSTPLGRRLAVHA